MGTESVDLIDAWHDLYVMLGTSSAALIGLLFIATSIHLGEVVEQSRISRSLLQPNALSSHITCGSNFYSRSSAGIAPRC